MYRLLRRLLGEQWGFIGSVWMNLAMATALAGGGLVYQQITAGDTQAPSAPASLTAASVTQTSMTLNWGAATDNVGVTNYRLYRNAVQINSANVLTFNDTGRTCNTSYTYAVEAQDASGNTGPQTSLVQSTSACSGDTTPPTVSLTAPTAGATVSGSAVAVSATASDNVGVTSVSFYRGGVTQIGAADTTSPYSVNWDSTGVANGSYTLTAVAVDAASNSTTSSGVIVTVSNGVTGTANLWLDTNGTGSCTRSSTRVAFNDATSCQDFGEVYQAEQCGDLALVRDGSYPDQTVVESTVGQTCAANRITIQAETSNKPTINWLGFSANDGDSTGPDNLTLRGFKLAHGFNLRADANNIIVDNFDGGSMTIGNADSGAANGDIPTNVLVENSDWGPCSPTNATVGGQPSDCYTHGDQCNGQMKLYNSQNITFTNNVVHDFRTGITDSCHFECFWIGATNTNITFDHNIFTGCETNSHALPCNSNEGTWIIENNWFGANNPGNAGFRWCTKTGSPGPATFIFRFNSFATAGSWGTEDLPTGTLGSNIYFIGNIFGDRGECPDTGVSTHMFYNTYLNDAPCTGETGGQTFTGVPYTDDGATFPDPVVNLHLTAALKTQIDNRVPPNLVSNGSGGFWSNLTTDWDGETRPNPNDGGNRDVGADERDSP